MGLTARRRATAPLDPPEPRIPRPEHLTAPRPHALWFAMAMERELQENDCKAGWDGCSIPWLLHRLRQEIDELERAIQHGKSPADVLSEAADAGNFLMMIADRYHDQAEARRQPDRQDD